MAGCGKVLVGALILGFCACGGDDVGSELYQSPGSYYEQGSLTVNRTSLGEDEAPKELEIYVPSGEDLFPVVLFQHGFTASIDNYETILSHLASHGFIVVAAQMYEPGDFATETTPEQETLDSIELVAWLKTNLADHIDASPSTEDFGITGHSRGGQVAFRVANETSGIAAFAGIDPVDSLETFGQTPYLAGPVELSMNAYIIGAGRGPEPAMVGGFPCAPAEAGHQAFYDALSSPVWHATATNHGHADMVDEDAIGTLCPGDPDHDGMRAFTAGSLAAFFSAELQGNGDARSILADAAGSPVPISVENK